MLIIARSGSEVIISPKKAEAAQPYRDSLTLLGQHAYQDVMSLISIVKNHFWDPGRDVQSGPLGS